MLGVCCRFFHRWSRPTVVHFVVLVVVRRFRGDEIETDVAELWLIIWRSHIRYSAFVCSLAEFEFRCSMSVFFNVDRRLLALS